MTDCSPATSVPDWIIDHPETLSVFEELGIDYSCGGKSLERACQDRALSLRLVLAKLHAAIAGEDRPGGTTAS